MQASRRKVEAAEVETAKKNADDASAALKEAQANRKKATAAREEAEAEHKTAKGKGGIDAETLTDFKRKQDIATVLEDLAKTREGLAKSKAEAAAKAHEDLRGFVGKWVESASLTVQPVVPDHGRRYVARHLESAWRDDVLSVGVSNGMLSSGEGKATGQASSIVLSLVKAAAGIDSGVSRPGTSRAFAAPLAEKATPPATTNGTKPKPKPCAAYDFALLFDPTDQVEFDDASAKLTKASNASLSMRAAAALAAAGSASAPSVSGLAYRAPRSISLEVAPTRAGTLDCPLPEHPAGVRLNIVLPDSSTTFVMPMDGAAFTKSSVKHVFKDGMLTEHTVDRPSTLASVASLPIDVLKAMISVPAELIKLRVDYSTAQASDVGQQVKLLEAQLALVKAQGELKDAQEAAKP